MDAVLTRTKKAQPRTVQAISLTATKEKAGWVAPSAVFLLGFTLRLAYIGHESVGFDEAFSMTVSRLPLHEMFRQLVADFVHPPLHYLVLRGWFKLFGFGVFQARLLSALFSTLAVVLLYVSPDTFLIAGQLFSLRCCCPYRKSRSCLRRSRALTHSSTS